MKLKRIFTCLSIVAIFVFALTLTACFGGGGETTNTGGGGDIVNTEPITVGNIVYENVGTGYEASKLVNAEVTDVEIIDTVEGMSVVSIGVGFLKGNTTVKSVTIPETVSEIRSSAFEGAVVLESVTLAGTSKLESISLNAFQGCVKLSSITIPSSVTTLGANSFKNCEGLVTVVFSTGSKISELPTSLFENAKALRQITIPDSVQIVGSSAFAGCTQLTNVNFSANTKVKTFGAYAFNGCGALLNFSIPSTVTSLGDSVFKNCYSLTDASIPSGIVKIDASAFENCISITEIVVPSNVRVIGKKAFYGCQNVTSIDIALSVTEFGSEAFVGLSKVESITMGGKFTSNQVFGSATNEFVNTVKRLTIASGETEIVSKAFEGYKNVETLTIAPSVTKIGASAFNGLSKITSLVIPNISIIETSTFEGCTSLTSITVPESVKQINKYAFRNCNQAISISVPQQTETIENMAFEGTIGVTSLNISGRFVLSKIFGDSYEVVRTTINSLTILDDATVIMPNAYQGLTAVSKIVVPASIAEIGNRAFENCTGLKELVISSKNTVITSNILQGSNALEKIIYNPSVALSLIFGNVNSISPLLTDVVILPESTEIARDAFLNLTGLTTIAIPTSIEVIGQSAFEGCTALSTISFGENSALKTIGDNAFLNCANLASISFANTNSLDKIGARSFVGTGITEINFPSSLKEIGNRAFNGLNLTQIVFPANLTVISDYAFYDCKSLSTVTFGAGTENLFIGSAAFGNTVIREIALPENLYSLGDYAFTNTLLTQLVIPAKVYRVGSYAFEGCSRLTKITFSGESTLKEIGDYAFANLYMSTFTIPSTVTSIGEGAFYNCRGLSDMTIPAIETIRKNTFANCEYFVNVVIPQGVKYIESQAFAGCKKVTSINISSSVVNIEEKAFEGVNEGFSTLTYNGDFSLDYLFGLSAQTIVNSLVALTINEGSTLIAENAFKGTQLITTITLPSSVTTISNGAFENSNIETLVAPGLVSIGSKAFASSQLSRFSLPSTLTVIGDEAFANTHIEAVVFSDNIYSIGEGAFRECLGLTSATFSATSKLMFLGDGAFALSNIDYIFIPELLTSIGNATFQNCPLANGVQFHENNKLKYVGEQAFMNARFTAISLPTSVNEIGAEAFAECVNLESFTLPRVVSIYDSVFLNCSRLTSILIPNTVTSINNYSFSGCSSLASVTFEADSILALIGENAFEDTSIVELVMPNTVSVVLSGAFKDCFLLESANISSALRSIPSSMFENCLSLKTINSDVDGDFILPTTITSIGAKAFKGTMVKKIDLLTISVIEESTFENCSRLTTVSLPANIEKVLGKAFANCSGLVSLELLNEGIVFAEDCFDGVKNVATITAIGSYSLSEVLGTAMPDFAKSVTTINIVDSSISIAVDAYKGFTKLTTISIPAGVTEIGNGAFENCSSLATIAIPDSLTIISDRLFKGCTNLSNIGTISNPTVFPTEIEYIGTEAFMNTALTTVNLNIYTNLSIGEGAFEGADLTEFSLPTQIAFLPSRLLKNCSLLTTIALPDSLVTLRSESLYGTAITGIDLNKVTTLEGGVFAYSKLIDITLPENLTSLPASLFEGCKDLTTVGLPTNLVNIGSKAFMDTSISSFDLSEIKVLGEYAFAGTMIDQITIYSDNFTIIPAYAFSRCSRLNRVEIVSGITEIGEGAFSFCSNLSMIRIPNTLEAIDDVAFENCGKLGEVVFEKETIIERIGNNIFKDCIITSITAPGDLSLAEVFSTAISTTLQIIILTDGTTEIADSTYKDYSSLISVTVPSTVTSIGNSAFQGCTQLETIDFEAGSRLALIGDNAFTDSGLKTFDFVSVREIGNNAFQGCKLIDITLPATITKMGVSIFQGNSLLSTINFAAGFVFPNNAIPDGTFQDCGVDFNMTEGIGMSITIPASTTKIGSKAFMGMNKLASINGTNLVTVIEENAFADCVILEDYTFANNILEINDGAFSGCSTLNFAILPASIEILGDKAFYKCETLTCNFAVGSNLESIGSEAFYGCIALPTTINIPVGVHTIGAGAFYDCTSIQSINFGDSLTAIADNVLFGAINLTSVYIPGTVSSVGVLPFGQTVIQTMTFGDNLQLKEFTSDLTGGVGQNNALGVFVPTISSITFGVNSLVEIIGVGALSNTSITSFVITENVKVIGGKAFMDVSTLTSITFEGQNVETIGFLAFYNCGALASISIDSLTSLKEIGYSAFENTNYGGVINLPDSVMNIQHHAFAGTNVSGIALGENSRLETIAHFAFYNTSVTQFTGNAGLKEVNYSAFDGCAMTTINLSLSKITVLEHITTTANVTIILPSTLTTISADAIKHPNMEITVNSLILGLENCDIASTVVINMSAALLEEYTAIYSDVDITSHFVAL